MMHRISRAFFQVCHQDATRAVGEGLQHNSSIFEIVRKGWRHACLALLVQGAAQAAEPFDATVLRVVDGDTLWVLPLAIPAASQDGAVPPPAVRRIKLRIEGIDAPEICQSHGAKSQRFLERWVLHATVRVRAQGQDRYRRQLAQVHAPDGQDIAAVMVREGQAWSYRTRWTRGAYAAEERAAQKERLGLFADPQARYPRDFRAEHGPCFVTPRQAPMPRR
jgi:endonuclease YncB( thermonuclease family)